MPVGCCAALKQHEISSGVPRSEHCLKETMRVQNFYIEICCPDIFRICAYGTPMALLAAFVHER